MALTLLHTAKVHRDRFNAIRDRIAPDQALSHVVREDFLERAQAGIDAGLESEIKGVIRDQADTVLCTCTTIGGVAAEAGAIRIDQPMMRRAAITQGDILMAYCLDSTFGPSLELLEGELRKADRPARVHHLPLRALWPLFEAGEHAAFTIGIAAEIRHVAKLLPDLGSIVLAQASMAGASDLLQDLGLPVLSSPELALRTALNLPVN